MKRNGIGWLVVVGIVCVGAAAAAQDATLVVRTQSILEKVSPDGYKAPAGAAAISLVGVRNGAYAGQVVVSSAAAIQGLKATAGGLSGAGSIPASAVTIRYPLPDGQPAKQGERGVFDSLAERPPAEAPVYAGGLAVQPVWVTVAVPAGAAPGEYRGTVTIAATGAAAVSVPLSLRVIDWTLPDANDYTSRMDIVESPESVALAYDVPLWSEEHWRLLDRTFALLRPLAVKTVYISAIRRTHFGNEHAMIRWYRDANGESQPDFSIAERYLDLAVKHLGKIPGVILLVWEPITSMGHAGGTGTAVRTNDKPLLYTLWDRKTNTLKERVGPDWGTPEAKTFWKKFTDGIQPVLARRGLADSMLFGLIGDSRPTKTAMDDITNAVKDPHWAIHSHHYAKDWQGYPIGMCVALWGIHLNITDPKQGRGFGWKTDEWLAYYPREFALTSTLAELRYKLEMYLGAYSQFEMQHTGKSRYACGLGRIGADFWLVLKDKRGRIHDSLAGRYPESYWGQLNLNYCLPYILGKGPDGPLATIRSEAFREGIQDAEVRIYIEKGFMLDDRKEKVGQAAADSYRQMLDERIRLVNRAGGVRSDQTNVTEYLKAGLAANWQESSVKLYEAADEIARKLGQ